MPKFTRKQREVLREKARWYRRHQLWDLQRIADELDVSRKTVGRWLAEGEHDRHGQGHSGVR